MPLSKNQQRRVWQRVYAQPPQPRPQPRPAIRAAQSRATQNLRFYESRQTDPVYGPAYQHLADMARQELAMLERLL